MIRANPLVCDPTSSYRKSSLDMSSDWSNEICLAEAVANSVHINSLVLINGRQASQLMVAFLL